MSYMYCYACDKYIKNNDNLKYVRIVVGRLDGNICYDCVDGAWPDIKSACDPTLRFYE